MFKITNDDTPAYLNRFFQKPNSRQRLLNYKLPLSRIDLFKTSLVFLGLFCMELSSSSLQILYTNVKLQNNIEKTPNKKYLK